MFKRFTERARQVVVQAQQEANAWNHDYLGTEHLLLGLLREGGGIAAKVLAQLEITVEDVRAQVERIDGRGDKATGGQIPLTPCAKKALELSLREALALHHNHIGTEHILLGIRRERDGVGGRILADFDADLATIRAKVLELLERTPPETPEAVPRLEPSLRQPSSWLFHVATWPTRDAADLTTQLNELGAQGWQLAAVVPAAEQFQWVFQRPIPTQPRRQRDRPRQSRGRGISRGTIEMPPSVPITVESGITLRDYAVALQTPIGELIKLLIEMQSLKTATQSLTDDEVETLAAKLGRDVTIKSPPPQPG
jgi:hypothetical protein